MWTTAVKLGAYALAVKEIADGVASRQNELVRRQNQYRNRNLLAGIVMGAAAGVTAGLLLAPCSGKKTREELRSRLAEAVDAWKASASNTARAGETPSEQKECGKEHSA